MAGNIRYQLIHRTGSAVIKAKRFGAPHAVMLVHSFSSSREWFQDFEAFALLLRTEAAINRVVYAGQRGGVHLHIGRTALYLEGMIRFESSAAISKMRIQIDAQQAARR